MAGDMCVANVASSSTPSRSLTEILPATKGDEGGKR